MASFPGQKSTGSPLPNPPQSLAVTGVTVSSVSLGWLAVSGALSYNLYRDGTQVQTGIATPSATDTGLSPGTSHTYTVTAVGSLGEGTKSNPATGTTGAVPNAPSSLIVTGTTTSTASLSWTAPVGGASTYNLYRNSSLVLSGISGTGTTDTGLLSSTTYTYFVTAVNVFGEGPHSNNANATTQSSGGVMRFQSIWMGASGGNFDPGNTLSKFQPELDDMLGTLVDGQPPDWVGGYRLFVRWAAIDEGPLTFTAPLTGTSGTLTSAPRHGNQTYTLRLSDNTYVDAAVTGTAATFNRSLTGQSASVHGYMFGLLDQIIQRCATAYNKPKWCVWAMVPMSFSGGTRKSTDFGIVPQYITQNVPLYGSSPDGSSSGWWGAAPPPTWSSGTNYNSGDQVRGSNNTVYQATEAVPAGNDPTTNPVDPSGKAYWQTSLSRAYTAKIYNHNVALEYANLGVAVNIRHSAYSNYYGIIDQETAAVVGPALARNTFGQNCVNDGSYSDSAYSNELLNTVYPAWRAAGPLVSLIPENSFLAAAASTQLLQLNLIQSPSLRVALGSADTLGHAYHVANPGALGRNWAMETYGGQTAGGVPPAGPDYRVTAPNPRCMMDCEGPDISSTINPNNVGTTPKDLCQGANLDYLAPNLFFCHVPAGRATTPPNYSATKTYLIGDQANVGGTWYEAIAVTTGNSPPNASFWKVITATPPTWGVVTRALRDNPPTTGKPGNYT